MKHLSHITRSSDSSIYDEVCLLCGATDIAGDGWGKLGDPCPVALELPIINNDNPLSNDEGSKVQC